MSLTALAGACLPSCAVLAERLECAPEGEAPVGVCVYQLEVFKKKERLARA